MSGGWAPVYSLSASGHACDCTMMLTQTPSRKGVDSLTTSDPSDYVQCESGGVTNATNGVLAAGSEVRSPGPENLGVNINFGASGQSSAPTATGR